MSTLPGSTPPSADLLSKRVLLTGATGFIGSHVLHELIARSATVTAVIGADRAASRTAALPPGVAVRTFDHPSHISTIAREERPDYVIHLHAVITTARTTAAIQSTLQSNVLPSIDLMTACTDIGVRRLIVLGSGEEFGPVTGPFDDTTIPDPPSPYGASKGAITCYARMFHRAFQLPVTVLRPSVVYGPSQSPRMLIPQVMDALRHNRPIDVTEGRQTRDFIHVSDVAHGIVQALDADTVNGRSFNLGSGEPVTVRQCLHCIEEITGRRDLIRYGAIPYKQGEIFTYEPRLESTFEALRWRPAISLREGLSSTWAWFCAAQQQ